MRKICVVTGTRAEYGLLYWTIKSLHEDAQVELSICATGMHLSPEFGLTFQRIVDDGFRIDEKIETLLSSDSSVGISKSIGLGVISFAEAYERIQPDIVLVLGDRFEIFAATIAALVAKIPVAHCHGGETTEGAFDEAFRHSITKMAHIHFTSTEEYRNRVIQLGEQPANVYNVGALGIENINKLKLLDRKEFEAAIDFKLNTRNLLVTFHPVTLDHASAESQFKALLVALDKLEDTTIIFTKPNADTDGRIIISLIDEYVARNTHKAVAFISLGQLRYLSAIPFMDAVVGNSSSGLLEVPSFKVPTINIGDRQQGRVKSVSVIDCKPEPSEITAAIEKALSAAFRSQLVDMENPYGTHNASDKIVEVLKTQNLQGLVKKQFYNLLFQK
ncbi:MAG: UDP-N-acetylglucosamine 2-epimerase (hydrolyzing) [Flavobacterium sp. BFFFF1]|uniref:UDP-N-acetylglucosamine 2-epimerase n=1 Tax=unclassified Flavobacterium TaxID=196869 RepID=UPI000BC9225E|nr:MULTISPECIES: UDP-N-acetylglucosamine 2-epimerase [unclassified Flavobacterium]OYU81528.1 MAG: UDP-N-acetylglucosamine 2-epimerase (hydrolyzing) [Flavobacterium sp. BFFFF1]